MNKRKIRERQPGLPPNSKQEVDNLFVSPAIANALVGGMCICRTKTV